LWFAQARYYDAGAGRFVGRDVVPGDPMNPMSLNPYTYCWNDPLGMVDLDGRIPIIPILVGIGKAIGYIYTAVRVGYAIYRTYKAVTAVAKAAAGIAATVGAGTVAVSNAIVKVVKVCAAVTVGATAAGTINIGSQVIDGRSWNEIDWNSVRNSALAGGATLGLAVFGVPWHILVGANAIAGGGTSIFDQLRNEGDINWRAVSADAAMSIIFARYGGSLDLFNLPRELLRELSWESMRELLSRHSPELLALISNLLERFENGDDACPSKVTRKQRAGE